MKWSILAFLLLGVLFAGVAYADTSVEVLVTARGDVSATSPTNLLVTVVSDYELQLTWSKATGNESQGTRIQYAYGGYPTSPTDSNTLYDGNGTSYTYPVWTEFTGKDIYYRAWADYGGGNYSVYYSSTIYPGGQTLAELTSALEMLQYMWLPSLLIVISFWKRSLVAFTAAIMALGLVLPYLRDSYGVWMVIPIVILMVGFALMFVRDAWEKRLKL